jgi:cellulose synthase/poly-beta-1,6-N-acetylglucosamine synthase-like glycosyltransferase
MTVERALLAAFWSGLGATAYVYAVFPLLMALVARAGRTRPGGPPPAESRGVVTVVVPAHNEERSLASKLRNVLATDYPRSLVDVIVISDASTDRTNDIARAFEGDGVRLVVQERRQGKTAGLNRALELARGDIVVFTDANAFYRADTIDQLARRFDDPAVGLVTGYTRYVVDDRGEIAEATNAYTALERVIKKAESRWGCCVGADGAIFAMRRALYRPLRHDDINDFVIPLNVIDQGYGCVFAEEAFCSEHPGASLESEFRRQSRITNRTLRALWRNARLLNPLRFGLFSLFLFSHKLLRFLVPGLLTVSAAALVLLARTSVWYLVPAVGAVAATLLAIGSRGKPFGALVESPAGRLLTLLNVFLTINLAVLQGWWSFLHGRTDAIWQHDRAAG